MQLAEKTGFSKADAEINKECLILRGRPSHVGRGLKFVR